MPAYSRKTIVKAACAAILSMVVTLMVAKVATYFFGGSLSGTGLLLCIVCPLVIGGPACAWQSHQQSLLMTANDELDRAKAGLERAYADLQHAYRQLDERARHDGLTGILNREGFISAINQALADRHGTLFILDADEFKQINDRHGHLTGDEALRALAGAIAGCAGDADLLGRIGGEEFAVFKPGVHGLTAEVEAERMRQAVRLTPIAVGLSKPIYLSVSMGGADSRDFADLDALWRAADSRLYAAKATGRDRFVLDGVTASPQFYLFPVEDADTAGSPDTGEAVKATMHL